MLVGKTEMGGKEGEGIVVKNQTRLNDKNSLIPFYTKIVNEKFCETHKSSRPVDLEELAEKRRLTEMTMETVSSVVTKAPVEKLLNKMVDDDLLCEDWDEKDMGIIAKNLTREVYHDCVKEENDVVESVGKEFGKYAKQISMKYAKEILNEKERVM